MKDKGVVEDERAGCCKEEMAPDNTNAEHSTLAEDEEEVEVEDEEEVEVKRRKNIRHQ